MNIVCIPRKMLICYDFPRTIPQINLNFNIRKIIIKYRFYHGICKGELLSMKFLKGLIVT